ncbi:MAG: hypothetical protein V1663_01645 [archaeon]
MNNIIVSEQDFLNTYKIKTFGHKALKKCKKYNWLPLRSSQHLSSIVGHLMGDGNLSKNRMVGDFRFYGDSSKLNRILYDLKNYFNLMPYAYYKHPKGGGYILRYNNAIFARILELMGVPRGDKILTAFRVPKWIINNNKKIKKSFLSALLTDEMSKINKNKRGQWKGFWFSMSKIKSKTNHLVYFLDQIRDLLNEFEITSSEVRVRKKHSYYRKDGNITYPAFFCIHTNFLNRKRFYFNIGFENKQKQKLLYKSIKNDFTVCGSAGDLKTGIWKKSQ